MRRKSRRPTRGGSRGPGARKSSFEPPEGIIGLGLLGLRLHDIRIHGTRCRIIHPMQKLLVSTAELASHLGDAGWVAFDTRHDLANPGKGRALYAESHVPGAYFLHLDEDLSGPKTGKNGRHPLPDIHDFAQRINACGVMPGTQVVVYDDIGGNFAVRLWWMLRWLGHDNVALLDGGFPLWQKEGRPVTKEVPAPRAGSFVPRPHLGWTVDLPFVE